jgi:hypothetical protein
MTKEEQFRRLDEVVRDLWKKGGPQRPSPAKAGAHYRRKVTAATACLLTEQQRLIDEWEKDGYDVGGNDG